MAPAVLTICYGYSRYMVKPHVPLQVITQADAQASARRAAANLDAAAAELAWQVERESWVTLGYRSWSAMRDAEYAGTSVMVPNKSHPVIVGREPEDLDRRIERLRVIEGQARAERLRLEALQAGGDRSCPTCGAAIVGRSDRKFCRTACRVKDHRAKSKRA